MAKFQMPKLFSKLSKREMLILYVGIVLVFLVLLERNVLSPVLYKLKILDKEIVFKEEVIQRSVIVLAHKKRLLEDKEKFSAFLNEPASEEKETNVFLKEIENLAKKSKVYLQRKSRKRHAGILSILRWKGRWTPCLPSFMT
ncbi:hypothetical protein ACFL3N_03360 [Candidatus Omnitrophota bacterium]